MDTPSKEIKSEAKKEILSAKTADDLNRLIARYLDKLEGPNLTTQDIRLAEIVSSLIGRQISVENAKINYERLSASNGKKGAGELKAPSVNHG